MTEGLDPDLASRAKSELLQSSVHALRALNVEQSGERLVIQGRVKSFYHKQLAQEMVRAVSGGLLVVNSVEVLMSRA
ncbi:MAG: BON domain-containing protein [Pirellulaceae bacterium]|nr:BON domain-containing protein [Pirellulaceae bacterium]